MGGVVGVAVGPVAAAEGTTTEDGSDGGRRRLRLDAAHAPDDPRTREQHGTGDQTQEAESPVRRVVTGERSASGASRASSPDDASWPP